MTTLTLSHSLKIREILADYLARRARLRKAARERRELALAARRLAAVSPHLLRDIGLTDSAANDL